MLHEHIYNTKTPIFYFCLKHEHRHTSNPDIKCIIREFKCCDDAICVFSENGSFNESFIVTVQLGRKKEEYLIYDPTIWRDQSFNHFMSFIRAVILSPEVASDRYACFKESNFVKPQMNRYIRGKESLFRTDVTGNNSEGTCQTATISCLDDFFVVLIPQVLYKELDQLGYDLDFAFLKRDPSIQPTCMYICAAKMNPDSTCMVIVASHWICTGMHLDVDGDKLVAYFLPKKRNGFDLTYSINYIIAKIETAAAFKGKRTDFATPRYFLSETAKITIERNREKFMHIPFFEKTNGYGSKFMNEAAAGYLSDESEVFFKFLSDFIGNEEMQFLTVDDLLLETTKLISIVTSGAKGSIEMIDMLLNGITEDVNLKEKIKEHLKMYDKFIKSGKKLSIDGRKQFAVLCALQDLISYFSFICLDMHLLADYVQFATAPMTFMYNEASLQLCWKDIKNLPE